MHVGNLSDGCTTVIDLARWADIHEALISHRSSDGNSVGKLIVKGRPERVGTPEAEEEWQRTHGRR